MSMLVRFDSTETGEVLMYAETARTLLEIIGKECTARGVFTREEMPGAVARLRAAVAAAGKPPEPDEDDDEARSREPVVGLSQRAWPLIDMLERTAASRNEAHVIWEAREAF